MMKNKPLDPLPKCEVMPLFYNGTYGGGCEKQASDCRECIAIYNEKKEEKELAFHA
jgi:hypothetical protein